jgi:hypothetical protein
MLGLVTGAGNPIAPRVMRRFARAHPRRTVLIDWRATNPHRYGGDGIHIGTRGESAEARFIARRVRPYMPPSRALARRVPRRAASPPDCGVVRRGDRDLAVFVVHGEVGCTRARALIRRPLRRPAAGWRAHDWRIAGRPPFTDVAARRTLGAIVAARPARPEDTAAPEPAPVPTHG